jgi:FixJ family two-component response regulator
MEAESGLPPTLTRAPILSSVCRAWAIEMAETQSVVYVVDDDSDVRNAMDTLMRSVGYKVRTFTSASEFLHAKLSEVPGCLVLDVRMPGMSGLDLQSEMTKANVDVNIVFITGHADVAMAVKVMKAGAVEFLTKPFRDQDLLDSIQHAVERDRLARQQRAGLAVLRQRFNSLTQRQREVMEYVVKGLLRAGELQQDHFFPPSPCAASSEPSVVPRQNDDRL